MQCLPTPTCMLKIVAIFKNYSFRQLDKAGAHLTKSDNTCLTFHDFISMTGIKNKLLMQKEGGTNINSFITIISEWRR